MAQFVLGLLKEWRENFSLQCCQDRNLSLSWSWCGQKKDIFSFCSSQGTSAFNWWFTKDFVSPMRERDSRKTQISKVSLIIYEIFFCHWDYRFTDLLRKKRTKQHRNKMKESKWKLGFLVGIMYGWPAGVEYPSLNP